VTSTTARDALVDPSTPRGDYSVPSGPSWIWRDSWTESLRHMRAIPRDPEQLVFATVQPIMFVVLFYYVFGGSIEVPGYSSYKQYLMPGIFTQAVLFNTAFTGVGIASDLQKGLIDRLRSLPMYPAAVLIGRTISDTMRNVITFFVMLVVSLLIGFRFEGTAAETALGTLLLFAFAYSFCWIQAYIGLSVGSVEAANSAGFIWMFPLTFVSSAFVDPATMPGWLQPIAEANPFTVLTDATRALYNGNDPGNDVWIATLWAIGITIVFAFLSARKYNHAARR
jgi:ABC transporter DrrB family efflux protein